MYYYILKAYDMYHTACECLKTSSVEYKPKRKKLKGYQKKK